MKSLISDTNKRREKVKIIVENSCHEFWDLLRSGTDAVTEIPEERWSLAQYSDANHNAAGKMNWFLMVRVLSQIKVRSTTSAPIFLMIPTI